jgi:hypothetical protein
MKRIRRKKIQLRLMDKKGKKETDWGDYIKLDDEKDEDVRWDGMYGD